VSKGRYVLVDVARTPRFDTVGDYTVLPEMGPDALPRNGVIVIRAQYAGSGKTAFIIELSGPAFGRAQSEPPLLAAVALSRMELQAAVEVCRREWCRVIKKSEERRRWFRSSTEQPWMLRVNQKEDLLEREAPFLARAGDDLFKVLFERGSDGLKLVRDCLRTALSGPPLLLTVYTDEFFLPWGMLYVDPAGQAPLRKGGMWQREGFVGYRHIIEQATDSFVPMAALPGHDNIRLGFTFDREIEREQGVRCINAQMEFFRQCAGLRPTGRQTKREIEEAFRLALFPDHVSYFFLHSITTGNSGGTIAAQFILAEESVEASEIRAWTSGPFVSQPLFFFNACQSGQMLTPFYESFALVLLDLHARGLIGPQIDIPTVFADEYARRFFGRFLRRDGSAGPRVGYIMRELVRQFFDQDKNPLALAYSLYKGADCYVDWQGPERTAA
jgi:hypothetical protein